MGNEMVVYQALAFDFDGVIIDSEAYKIETFKSLFTDFPEHLEAIDMYNRRERGINRRIKFEHIYKNILQLPYSNETLEALAESYGAKLKQNALQLPLISSIKEFLQKNELPAFVASSSEKAELELILKHHDMLQYFTDIYAYPHSKVTALQAIASRLKLDPNQILFFGDAIADYEAAQVTGAQFIARSDDVTLFPADIRRISNFSGLSL